MTLHPPKERWKTPAMREERRPAPRAPRAVTLGDLLGDQIRAVQAERARRAELDAMGFRHLQSET